MKILPAHIDHSPGYFHIPPPNISISSLIEQLSWDQLRPKKEYSKTNDILKDYDRIFKCVGILDVHYSSLKGLNWNCFYLHTAN